MGGVSSLNQGDGTSLENFPVRCQGPAGYPFFQEIALPTCFDCPVCSEQF
jgi:hypothetical protein